MGGLGTRQSRLVCHSLVYNLRLWYSNDMLRFFHLVISGYDLEIYQEVTCSHTLHCDDYELAIISTCI